MTRIALTASILLLTLAGATAQETKTDAEKNAELPSIAEEAAISGAGDMNVPGALDGEEKNMDEMEDAENQDGCSGTNDDPGVCDGQLLD
tara:strand:- start:5143 stop:5412 length:270 start_codon:yes stop_codon:yes gene_type:complete